MILKNGIINCQCGNSFEWKTFFQEKNTAVFFKWNVVEINVIDKFKDNNQFHITAQCPICYKKHFIILDE